MHFRYPQCVTRAVCLCVGCIIPYSTTGEQYPLTVAASVPVKMDAYVWIFEYRVDKVHQRVIINKIARGHGEYRKINVTIACQCQRMGGS